MKTIMLQHYKLIFTDNGGGISELVVGQNISS